VARGGGGALDRRGELSAETIAKLRAQWQHEHAAQLMRKGAEPAIERSGALAQGGSVALF
jgi:hypothetical protein